MNEIDVLKILFIRFKHPEQIIRQSVAQSITDLIIKYKNNHKIKIIFLEWLKTQNLETIYLIGLGIINLVNKKESNFFTLKDILDNTNSFSVLSDRYLKIMFQNFLPKKIDKFIRIVNPNISIDKEGWIDIPLEKYIEKQNIYIDGFRLQWINEFNFLKRECGNIIENPSYYNATNISQYCFLISHIAASSLLRTLNWAYYTGAINYQQCVDMAEEANSTNIDLLNLSYDTDEIDIESMIENGKYNELLSQEKIPLFIKFYKKKEDQVFVQYKCFLFLENSTENIKYEQLQSQLADSCVFSEHNFNFSSKILNYVPMNIKNVLTFSSGTYFAFNMIFNSNVRIINNKIINYNSIDVERNKISFKQNDKEIGFFKFWLSKFDNSMKIPIDSNYSYGTFVDGEVINNFRHLKIGLLIKKKLYKQNNWRAPFSITNEESKIIYLND
ncbi:hypothetical protein MASR1M68_03550 [Elusimicrobiota bacterium]